MNAWHFVTKVRASISNEKRPIFLGKREREKKIHKGRLKKRER